ncbi:cupin [Cyanobium sp. HWJ4-Hawea]|uniref:cupin n=1 Tax=Cyanobium sp. HWJ4-Hawea TaxID=2823713 RepID=UPI0039658B40
MADPGPQPMVCSAAIHPNNDSKALLFDYRQAANPVRRGLSDPIPYHSWGPELHASGSSAILPLDLSAELGAAGPATSPGLAAHFIRLDAGEAVKAAANATSSLFFVLSGSGRCGRPGEAKSEPVCLNWNQGDLFVLPAGAAPLLEADSTSVLYWVHDAPLLNYLGVVPSLPRFETTYYPGTWLKEELLKLAADPSSARSNRLSLLLANSDLPNTRTVTHVLWAMFGMVPAGASQAPHRHQSVALDLITECEPGCYTLVGTELEADGSIRDPKRIDWQAGGAFITPPGHWHAHVNESGSTAYLLPIQDAGLMTYLRSLDIRFA